MLHIKMEGERNISKQIKANKNKKRKKKYTKTKNKITKAINNNHACTHTQAHTIHSRIKVHKKKPNFTSQ